jgi:hypothetical protein
MDQRIVLGLKNNPAETRLQLTAIEQRRLPDEFARTRQNALRFATTRHCAPPLETAIPTHHRRRSCPPGRRAAELKVRQRNAVDESIRVVGHSCDVA